MIDFTQNTFEVIRERQLDDVPDIYDKRDSSLIYTALMPESWWLQMIYLALGQVQENAYIGTAVGEYLDMKVAERAVFRKPGTSAIREGEFDVPVELGVQFETMQGETSQTFTVFEFISQDTAEPFYYHYKLSADIPGILGNDYNGEILPIDYVEDLGYAMLTNILTPGVEAESDEALRARFEYSFIELASNGNIAAYRQEILKFPGVGDVQVYPTPNDIAGTGYCSILDTNYNIATPSLTAAVQTQICPPEAGDSTPSANGYGFSPINAKVTIGTATQLTIDVAADISVGTGFSISGLTPAITAAIESYLLECRKGFGTTEPNTIEYSMTVYSARMTTAILGVLGVTNVSNVLLNEAAQDIACTETIANQQIPVKGTVTLNAIT